MYRLIIFAVAINLFILQVHAQQPCQPPTPLISQGQTIFTEEQEAHLGDAIAEHLQRDFRVIADETITDHLDRIGQRLIKHLPPTSLRFQFLLVDLPDANAFVLPGGRIYISRKLVAFTESEDELAGVIAHEAGHLVARHNSITVTRLFREVLGVTEVKGRDDIFEKYNQLVENAARKPKAFKREDRHDEKDQILADQIGLFALALAGYNPESYRRFFDRLAETRGKTGNFFSDLFGTTKPEARRLREIIKGVAGIPASCIETRKAVTAEEFQSWQSSVINYTGLGRKESLHAVRSKVVLDPPLRGEITHIRFSPDGKYLLAQDDSGINVLSSEPFAPLFRIEAPEALPAQFTPDSRDIVFHNSDLRVEVWEVDGQKLKSAHELFVREICLQTLLSPDGKILACLDIEMGLNLFDVASGARIFQKKSFYTPGPLQILVMQLNLLLAEEGGGIETDWIKMGFSPDGRYFAAGARGANINSLGYFSTINALAVDLTTRKTVSLGGPLKNLIAGGFTFAAPDRLIGIDARDSKKSAMVSFPGGEMLDQIPLSHGRLAVPGRGNYLLIRPFANYPVGVMDLSTKTVFKVNKLSALDVYGDISVAERINGELALYATTKNDLRAKVLLPRNPLGRLHAMALSPDFKWLAVSERARGAVWNLSKGARVFHVRGFRGGYFAGDGALYSDFPKFEKQERCIVRLDMTNREAIVGPEITEPLTRQHGPFLLITKPDDKGKRFNENTTVEVRDANSMALLWSRTFDKEAPRFLVNSQEETMVLSWSISSQAAKKEIKNDSELARRLSSMKDKEGDYFIQVLDARTGNPQGRLLIETGKGSFRISHVIASGDYVVVSDTQNRVLVYSLSSGEQKGKLFGGRAALSRASDLLCAENEPGQLTVYDLASMEKRDQFTFSSPVSLARFSKDGKSLFVLTANQTAFVLDLSSLVK